MNLIDIEQEDTILSPTEVFSVSNSTVGAIPRGFDGRPIMEWIDEPSTVGDLGQRGSGEFDNRFGYTQKKFNDCGTAVGQQVAWAKNALQKWEKATNSYQPMTPTSNALKYTACGWTQVDEVRAIAFIYWWNYNNQNAGAKILPGYPVGGAYSVLDWVLKPLKWWVDSNTSPSGSYGQYGGQLFGADGTIGDAAACNDIQNQINNQQASRNQLNQTKIQLQEAALQAAQAGDQATANQLSAQAGSMGAQITAVDASIAQLKKLKETCMGLAPGCDPQTPCPAGLVCVDGKCVQPGTPPPPKCSATNPCPAGQKCVDGNCVTVPTTASKPASRSWLLLAAGALVTGFFALKGA